MQIHKTGTDENGTRLPNELLQDQRLSYAARGLLVKLLIKPDGWQGTADDIARELRKQRGSTKYGEGVASIRALFTELEQAGYMIRRRQQTAQGRFETVIEVYDEPQTRAASQPLPASPRSKPLPSGEYLYRHWDEDSRLLYVGVAANPIAREKRHRASSSWMEFQASMTVERFETRAGAEEAETAAIEAERPLFNLAGNDTPEAQRRLVEYLVERGRSDLLAPAVSRG